MRRPIAVFGAGSLGRLASAYLGELGAQVVPGFVVDDEFATAGDAGLTGWSAFASAHPPGGTEVFVAVGYRDFHARARAFARVRAAGYEMPDIVCRTAYVARGASFGRNNFIMPGAVVEPGVRLGDNNVVWSNVTICHDTVVGDHNFIAANTTIGGEACIGDRNFLGFSSVLLHGRRIADDVLLGAQSTMTSDALQPGVYVGSPARRIRDVDPAVGLRVE